MTTLNHTQITDFIRNHSGWLLENGRLEKTFVFSNFSRAMVFVNKIINPIEEFQSYPVIRIAYNRVLVSLFNNMQGKLTELELSIAKEMDQLA